MIPPLSESITISPLFAKHAEGKLFGAEWRFTNSGFLPGFPGEIRVTELLVVRRRLSGNGAGEKVRELNESSSSKEIISPLGYLQAAKFAVAKQECPSRSAQRQCCSATSGGARSSACTESSVPLME